MNTDKYTKVLLTIIAICLVNLSFKGIDLFPQAHAGEEPGLQYGLVPLNADGSITVRLSTLEEIEVNVTKISTSDELEVNLTGISTSDELDVNIDEVGGHFIHVNSGIPVKIKD